MVKNSLTKDPGMVPHFLIWDPDDANAMMISIGKSPQVALSPPVTVTCDVVAAMHKWVTGDVQALAKKHLGAHVIGIDTMSSYSCRNAYGRKAGRLSEHARANAVDLRGFFTSSGGASIVLADWGPTAGDIQDQVNEARVAAKKAEAARGAGGGAQGRRLPPIGQLSRVAALPLSRRGAGGRMQDVSPARVMMMFRFVRSPT